MAIIWAVFVRHFILLSKILYTTESITDPLVLTPPNLERMYAVAALGFDIQDKSLPCLPSSFRSPFSILLPFPSPFYLFSSLPPSFLPPSISRLLSIPCPLLSLPPYPTLQIQLRSLGSTVSSEAGLGGSRLPNAFLCFGSLISGLSNDRFGRFLLMKLQSVCCVYAYCSAFTPVYYISAYINCSQKEKI